MSASAQSSMVVFRERKASDQKVEVDLGGLDYKVKVQICAASVLARSQHDLKGKGERERERV
jgi:hypothetical protein